MKRFTKIVENNESEKYFKVQMGSLENWGIFK